MKVGKMERRKFRIIEGRLEKRKERWKEGK